MWCLVSFSLDVGFDVFKQLSFTSVAWWHRKKKRPVPFIFK